MAAAARDTPTTITGSDHSPITECGILFTQSQTSAESGGGPRGGAWVGVTVIGVGASDGAVSGVSSPRRGVG